MSSSEVPTNDAVTWSGTRFGLVPTLSQASLPLAARGEAVVPELLAALGDPHRFVTAHVLLTKISGVQHEMMPTWNGLAVEIDAGGKVTVDPAQRDQLARRWKRWYESSPRLQVLPGS